MFVVLNDAALYEFTGETPPPDIAALTLRYERWEARSSPDGSELWFNWVLSLRPGSELIGYVQASVLPSHAHVAWVVGSRWQKHGYATEAAKKVLQWLLELGIRDIRASIHPNHVASIRIAEH